MGSPGEGRRGTEISGQVVQESFVPTSSLDLSQVRACLDRSVSFTEKLGLETYDPYDIKATNLAVWSYQKQSLVRRVARAGLYGVELFFPIAIRKVLGIPKKESAGGTARWAQANIALYKLNGEARYLDTARTLLNRLVDDPGPSRAGMGWGVPFVWKAYFGTVPPYTAVSHTSQGVGNALIDFFEVTAETWAKGAADKCADFFTKGLNQTITDSGAIALSYTHLDQSQVVNASAEAAGFLRRCGRPEDRELISKVAQFVWESQNADGSWYYSAPGSVEGSNPIDSYHTAMNLNGLLEFCDDSDCLASLEHGLRFHLENHFDAEGCPKMRPDALYPIDSHSAGESILVLTKAIHETRINTELREQAAAVLDRLVRYTMDKMSYPDGGFVYRIFRQRPMRLDSLRWSQAMLVHGFAAYLLPPKSPRL